MGAVSHLCIKFTLYIHIILMNSNNRNVIYGYRPIAAKLELYFINAFNTFFMIIVNSLCYFISLLLKLWTLNFSLLMRKISICIVIQHSYIGLYMTFLQVGKINEFQSRVLSHFALSIFIYFANVASNYEIVYFVDYFADLIKFYYFIKCRWTKSINIKQDDYFKSCSKDP